MEGGSVNIWDDRRIEPLFTPDEYPAPQKATLLTLERCNPQVARRLNAMWHSRLPKTQKGPWMLAFVAHYRGTAYGAALWHNPSARTLPGDWLELRRLAIAPDAPPYTASFMLGGMARWIFRNLPVTRLISYQDNEVHTGTIYRAAGWIAASVSKARTRDRTKARVGTQRDYRSNQNGSVPDSSSKTRWELGVR